MQNRIRLGVYRFEENSRACLLDSTSTDEICLLHVYATRGQSAHILQIEHVLRIESTAIMYGI